MRSLHGLLLAPVLGLALLGACSDDTNAGDAVDEASTNAVEATARNIASAQGEDEFSAHDVDVEGDLTCKANADKGTDAVDISCTGTSTDNQALAILGTTNEIPGASVTELEGHFVGTAGGKDVFAVDTLGG